MHMHNVTSLTECTEGSTCYKKTYKHQISQPTGILSKWLHKMFDKQFYDGIQANNIKTPVFTESMLICTSATVLTRLESIPAPFSFGHFVTTFW